VATTSRGYPLFAQTDSADIASKLNAISQTINDDADASLITLNSGGPLTGTVPSAAKWMRQIVNSSVTTDANGRWLVNLPQAFPNAFVACQVTNATLGANWGAGDALWTLYPALGVTKSQIWLVAIKSSTGALYPNAKLSFCLTAIGC